MAKKKNPDSDPGFVIIMILLVIALFGGALMAAGAFG
jgi:hypothetical protein